MAEAVHTCHTPPATEISLDMVRHKWHTLAVLEVARIDSSGRSEVESVIVAAYDRSLVSDERADVLMLALVLQLASQLLSDRNHRADYSCDGEIVHEEVTVLVFDDVASPFAGCLQHDLVA